VAESTKRLGRGLSSLIASNDTPSKLDDRLSITEESESSDTVTRARLPKFLTNNIPVLSIIANPSQPRRNIPEKSISKLAKSIIQNGLIQPIVVRPIPVGEEQGDHTGGKSPQPAVKYELIAGERRWRAAREAGLSDVPAIIRETNDQQLLELSLIENIHREDLNAIDRALAYKQFKDRFGLSADKVSSRVGEDRTTVANYLRLLELPPEIQNLLSSDLISMGHARALLSLSDKALQQSLAQKIIIDNLSVREVEDLVRQHRSPQEGKSAKHKGNKEKRAHIRDLERQFCRALQTKVRLQESSHKNRGRIIIEYQSLDDFDRICELLGVQL